MAGRDKWGWWALGFAAAAGFTWLRREGRVRPGPMPVALEGFFLTNPLRRRWFGPSRVLPVLGSLTGRRVGEIGVGVGVIGEALARAVGPQGQFFGVDVQPAAVEQARRRLAARGLAERSHLEVADGRRLPWPDGQLDVVVMVAMLGEVPAADRVQVLQEARRVIAAGGRLAVTEFWPDPHYLPPSYLRMLLRQAGWRPLLRYRAAMVYTLLAVPEAAAPK